MLFFTPFERKLSDSKRRTAAGAGCFSMLTDRQQLQAATTSTTKTTKATTTKTTNGSSGQRECERERCRTVTTIVHLNVVWGVRVTVSLSPALLRSPSLFGSSSPFWTENKKQRKRKPAYAMHTHKGTHSHKNAA